MVLLPGVDEEGQWQGPCRIRIEQRVLEREIGLGASRITLAGAAPFELTIDASRVMAFGQDHVQASKSIHTIA